MGADRTVPMKPLPLERIHAPSPDAFRRDYATPMRPVVVTGVASTWPAAKSWSLDAFNARFGDIHFPLRSTDDEFAVFFQGATRKAVKLSEYFSALKLADASGRRPPYLGNIPLTNNPVTADLFGALASELSFPEYFDAGLQRELRLWVAAKGQRSTIHNDTYDNLNAQITGSKRFLLFAPDQYPHLYTQQMNEHLWVSRVDPSAPDLNAFPSYAQAQGYEVTLEPGDILYIPTFWWHQATCVSTAINVNQWVYRNDHKLWSQAAHG